MSLNEFFVEEATRAAVALARIEDGKCVAVIAAAIEAGMIKADEKVGGSRKFARYLPFWARFLISCFTGRHSLKSCKYL
jgi:ATP-dependent DNA helicase RecG